MDRTREMEDSVDLGIPLVAEPILKRAAILTDARPATFLERRAELFDARAGIGDERHGGGFGGVELADVECDEPDRGVLPGSPAGGREVAEAGPIGVTGGSAANRTHLQGVIP